MKALTIGCAVSLSLAGVVGCGEKQIQEDRCDLIQYVKECSFPNDGCKPVGKGLESVSTDLRWESGVTDSGIRFVEVSGKLKAAPAAEVVQAFNADVDADFREEFCNYIPVVSNFLATATDYADLPEEIKCSKLWDDVAAFMNPSSGEDGNEFPAGFADVADALILAIRQHKDSEVAYRIQFQMLVPEYEYDDGRIIRKPISRFCVGYSSVMFSQGPYRGHEQRFEVSEIVR